MYFVAVGKHWSAKNKILTNNKKNRILHHAYIFPVSYDRCFMTIFLLSLNYLDGGMCKMLGKMYIFVISLVFCIYFPRCALVL